MTNENKEISEDPPEVFPIHYRSLKDVDWLAVRDLILENTLLSLNGNVSSEWMEMHEKGYLYFKNAFKDYINLSLFWNKILEVNPCSYLQEDYRENAPEFCFKEDFFEKYSQLAKPTGFPVLTGNEMDLTEKQQQQLILMFAAYSSRTGLSVSEEQLEELFRWIKSVLIAYTLTNLIINGNFKFGPLKSGEVSFVPVQKLSQEQFGKLAETMQEENSD